MFVVALVTALFGAPARAATASYAGVNSAICVEGVAVDAQPAEVVSGEASATPETEDAAEENLLAGAPPHDSPLHDARDASSPRLLARWQLMRRLDRPPRTR